MAGNKWRSLGHAEPRLQGMPCLSGQGHGVDESNVRDRASGCDTERLGHGVVRPQLRSMQHNVSETGSRRHEAQSPEGMMQ